LFSRISMDSHSHLEPARSALVDCRGAGSYSPSASRSPRAMRLRLLTRRENDKVRFADDPPAIEQSRGRSPDSDTGPHNWYMLPMRFIFLLAIVCAALQLGGAQTKWRKVSDFQFNWNGRRNVKVILEIPEPWIVLHKNEFGIQELKDLDADGTAELVGYPCLPQEFGNGLLTYDPFNVYKLGPAPGDAATISIPLSRSYNLEHYYGWAGVACSEKIAVALHPPGRRKPTIMSTEQAQRLTEGYR